MKKLLALMLALALVGGMAAPAYAQPPRPPRPGGPSGIRVENRNWINEMDVEVESEAEVGEDTISGNAGAVSLTNELGWADAWADLDENSNDTEIDCECLDGEPGPCGGSDGSISVSNSNGVKDLDVEIEAEAEVGEDTISGNAGTVTVSNGSATAYSTGFVTVNSNVTRITGGGRDGMPHPHPHP